MVLKQVNPREFKWMDSILPGVTKLFSGKVVLYDEESKKVFLASKGVYNVLSKLHIPVEWIGVFFAEVGEEIKFGFYVAEKYSKFGKKRVVVTKFGEEKFLYRRNLTKKYISSFSNDISKGDIVVVTNKFNEALGFGKAMFSSEEGIKEGTLVKNILDRGFFVKH